MFQKSQRFYDAIYAWKDYRREADRLHGLIQERRPAARTLLDVACGTGKHLELLRERYDVAGLDADPEMLEIARERLGEEVPLHVADLADFDLGRRFDIVTCLFSSIAYTRTEEELGRAVSCMARHLQRDGLLVVEPFFHPDSFERGKVWAIFVDEPDLKIARMDTPGVEDGVADIEFHYLVGTPKGIEHLTERHHIGLFTDGQYRKAFRAAGLQVEHDTEGLMGRGLYIGMRVD